MKAGISAFLLVLVPSLAATSSGLPTSVPKLRDGSEAVVRARAVSAESRPDDRTVFTFVTIEVIETLYGSAAPPLVIKLCGGRIADGILSCSHEAKLPIGAEFVAFLSRWPTGELRVPGEVGVSLIDRTAVGQVLLRGGFMDGFSLDDFKIALESEDAPDPEY